jgi:hypothetical protein
VALPWSSRGVVNLLLLVTADETQIESRLLDRRLKLHSPIGFVAETELAVVHSLEGSAEHANAVVFADRGSDHFDAPIVEFLGYGEKFGLALFGDFCFDDTVNAGLDVGWRRKIMDVDLGGYEMVVAVVGGGARGALRWD